MCFTKEISAGLGTLGAIMTLDQIRRYRKGDYPYPTTIIVYLLYTVMEWFQYVQHLHGFAQCDDINTKLTLVAHVLIWIQPIALNLHSFYYCKDNERILFRFTMFCTCLTFCVSSYALYVGYLQSLTNSFPSTEENIHNLGPQMCTVEDGPHFSWYFPYDSLQGYRPMGYSWTVFAVLPHFFRRNSIDSHDWFGHGPAYGVCILAGWIVTYFLVGSFGSPHWSMWCLHSVTYLVTPYIVWYFFVPFFPRSWFDSPIHGKEKAVVIDVSNKDDDEADDTDLNTTK
jgi:hypothetical protein